MPRGWREEQERFWHWHCSAAVPGQLELGKSGNWGWVVWGGIIPTSLGWDPPPQLWVWDPQTLFLQLIRGQKGPDFWQGQKCCFRLTRGQSFDLFLCRSLKRQTRSLLLELFPFSTRLPSSCAEKRIQCAHPKNPMGWGWAGRIRTPLV